MNKVRCVDGAWRTLDGHEIYHHKKSAGALYQAALRAELTARLPVGFGPVSEHGQAEVTGVPEELLTAWSTRTAAVHADAAPTIAEAETALGRPVTATERARIIKTAVLATRPAKPSHVPEADLRRRWIEQAAELGWNQRTLEAAIARPAANVAEGWQQQVIVEAVVATGRSKAIWSRADLTIQVAARLPAHLGPGVTSDGAVAQLEELTERALAASHPAPDGQAIAGETYGVVPLGSEQSGATARASDHRYASQELVDTEARILEHAITGGFRTPRQLHPDAVTTFIGHDGVSLSAEQRQAAVRVFASLDLVTVVTAPAGAGKTTVLGAVARMWAQDRRKVSALGPLARAAAELGAAVGVQGATVARWLTEQRNRDNTAERAFYNQPNPFPRRGPVVVVDEASMLSTADLDELTAYLDPVHGQLVLVGDPAQIGAVNAPGGMFEHLAHTLGPRVVELGELHRFRQPWEAAATLRLRDGDPTVVREYAERDRVHAASTSEDAADTVFNRWQQAIDRNLDALMLARAWADVTALNARARAAAVATGQVTGPVLANVTSRTASTSGHPEQRGWRAGDLLLAKKNSPHLRVGPDPLRNGDRFRVLATADTGLVVEDLTGRGTTMLPITYLARHAEYGWASTIDGAQGATTDVGILLARSGLDREHLYVGMTRGRLENHVHTTPELATGDAGPHRGAAVRVAHHGGAEGRGDVTAALDQLALAVANSGRERAAHTMLDAPVQQARERDWSAHEASRAPAPLPFEHRQNLRDLDWARADRDARQARIDHDSDRLLALETRLAAVPFWGRRRRSDLTQQVDSARDRLRVNVADLGDADRDLAGIAAAVDADTAVRDAAARSERERRHAAWSTRSSRPYQEPTVRSRRPSTRDSRPYPTPYVIPRPSRNGPVRGL